METPVDGNTARRLLSPCGDPKRPMNRSRYSAILGAMGISGARLVFVSQIAKFIREHPQFSESAYYEARRAPVRVGAEVPCRVGNFSGRFVVLEVDGKGRPVTLKAAA